MWFKPNPAPQTAAPLERSPSVVLRLWGVECYNSTLEKAGTERSHYTTCLLWNKNMSTLIIFSWGQNAVGPDSSILFLLTDKRFVEQDEEFLRTHAYRWRWNVVRSMTTVLKFCSFPIIFFNWFIHVHFLKTDYSFFGGVISTRSGQL